MKSRNVRESLFLAALFTSFIAPRAEATSNYGPWIDKNNIGAGYFTCGALIAISEDNKEDYKIACAGLGKKVAGLSDVDYALVLFFDLLGQSPNPESKLALPETLLLESSKPGPSVAAAKISLQPPSIPTAAGSGTSLTSNATCAVGYQDAGFQTPYHAFRWTEAGGPVDLGTLVPASNSTLSSFAWDTSADCDTVVGFSDLNGGLLQHAFRWTQAAGMVDLGAPAGASRASRAFAASDDGTAVVGDAEFVDGGTISGYRRSAFRWTTTGGFTDLGGLEALFQSLATAISADGSVVAGQAAVTNGSRAFRWTQSGGMVAIGPLSGHAAAAATGVSADGRIVVGVSAPSLLTRNNLGFNYDADTRAFRWTAATGIQDLRQLLIADGADLTGINLVAVTAISADGQWIAGLATTPSSGTSLVAFLAQYCDASIVGTCLAPPVASGPAATLSATSSNAGNVTRGLTQAAAAITLTNSGDSSLTLSGLNISGTDSSEFTVAHDCGPLPATLAPSASCTLTPSFAPTSAGAKSAALTLATDVSGTQPSIALAGVGADFSLSATNAVASVAAGQSATLPLSLTTSGAALTRAVTFGSSGAPQGVTVSFSPASLEAGAASGSITATITTTSRVLAANLRGSDILHASGLIPALFALLLVTGYRQRSRVLGTLVVLLMIGALSSCGSGGGGGGGGSNTPPAANPNGTPAGNYTITINAAGGGVTRSTTVTLTVT